MSVKAVGLYPRSQIDYPNLQNVFSKSLKNAINQGK